MKDNKADKNIAYTPEPGEKELAKLIKEAGETARARKKKAMDEHLKKLHAAIAGTLSSTQKTN